MKLNKIKLIDHTLKIKQDSNTNSILEIHTYELTIILTLK